MTTSGEAQSTEILLLASALEKGRTHAGLTADRLRSDRTGAIAPLLGLVASRDQTACAGENPAAAAFDLICRCVRENLQGTQQIVADVVLGLGLHSEVLMRAGIDPSIVRPLYDSALGHRRATLLRHWNDLHRVLNLDVRPTPSDRALRGSLETAVLRELAAQLVLGHTSSAGPSTNLESGAHLAIGASSTGRVIVIGGAVMDATFGIKTLPAPDTSTEAHRFNLSPGGKGLTQAVAAARLGLKTSLIAAITDDAFGEEIMQYLETEGVDTSLVKRIKGHTPFTGVLERELGDNIAVTWRNRAEVVVSVRDIDERYDDLAACDALLLTFEVPRDVMQHTLTQAHRNQDRRPAVIVTPGQPYVGETISREAFSHIDYLVAHPWELDFVAPHSLSPFDPDPVARSLLVFGLETICLLVNGGCTVYSKALDEPFSVPSIPAIYKESSASRDVFCAALAARLIDNEQHFTNGVALWAAAAMTCAAADFALANSMPDRKRVDELLARYHLSVSDELT